jgi:peptidylprolyl isomerase
VRRLLTAVVVTAALSGCAGSSGGQLGSGQVTDAPVATQGPVAGSPGACVSAPPTAAAVNGTVDLKKKPQVEVPDGPPPCNLVIGDIVTGVGPAAKAGDQLTMKYVGVLYATGKQFDASWDRGQDFPFTLGAGNVIQGWDQGLVGMKAGGRRQLVIPPTLGYGDQGAGADIPPGATLIFVVDLVKIG